MTAELDAEIARTSEIVEQRREAAEAALQVFFDQAAVTVASWMRERVKAHVTSAHETTTKLGPEKIAALKADLAKSSDEAPQLVRRWLEGKNMWAHRADYRRSKDASMQPSYRAYVTDTAMPSFLREPLGEVARKFMVDFMHRHGFKLHTVGTGAYYLSLIHI